MEWRDSPAWFFRRSLGEFMAELRPHRCGSCKHHIEGPSACLGRCALESWQPGLDALRFVRDRELGCYQGMGVDLWVPKNPGWSGTATSSTPPSSQWD